MLHQPDISRVSDIQRVVGLNSYHYLRILVFTIYQACPLFSDCFRKMRSHDLQEHLGKSAYPSVWLKVETRFQLVAVIFIKNDPKPLILGQACTANFCRWYL